MRNKALLRAAPRIACCGGVVLDFIFEVERIPRTPEKVPAFAFREGGGGLAATAAVSIASLGGAAEFWGRVGDDAHGLRLANLLRNRGVTPFVERSPGGRTPVSTIMVDRQGERMLAYFGSETLDPDPKWLPIETITAFDAVLCDVRWTQGARAVLTQARAQGIPSVLDIELAASDDVAALTALSDYNLFSAPALTRFTGIAEPQAALRAAADRTQAVVGVTLGKRGFLWLDKGRCWLQPAFQVKAIETNGAGDAFHGAFAFAIARGGNISQAARFASATAALKCTRRGGWDSMPSAAEVEDLLASQPAVTAATL
jgi:sulfofructose kinase